MVRLREPAKELEPAPLPMMVLVTVRDLEIRREPAKEFDEPPVSINLPPDVTSVVA